MGWHSAKKLLKKIKKNLCRVAAGLALGKVTVNGTGAVTVAFLCRVSLGHKRHSAKRALPIKFLPCVLCRVQFGLCRVPQALGKEPESSCGESGWDWPILYSTLVLSCHQDLFLFFKFYSISSYKFYLLVELNPSCLSYINLLYFYI